jgi:hypothetical protein
MKHGFVSLCGMIALLLVSLSTRCPAQTIAVKSGDSIGFMGDSITEQGWDSKLLKTATSQAAQANMNLGNVMPLGDSITKGAPAGAYRDPLFALLKNGGYTFKFVGSLTENPTAALTAAGQDRHEGHSGMGMCWIDEHL